MILKNLRLHNFRNFSNEVIEFSNLNIICGGNAQGKTNLLEAIYLLSTGRSFRFFNLKDLIKHGEKYFYLEAEMVKDLVAHTIKIYFEESSKKIQLNSTLLPSFTSLLGIMPSVLHAPSDIEIISGLPNVRRRFLNLHIAQYDPLYVHHLARFTKALKQRNFLLRNPKENIEIWEAEMAKSAVYLTEKRKKMIGELSSPLNEIMGVLSQKKETINLHYISSLSENPSSYLAQLEKTRRKDMLLGITQIGPHRDDFVSYIDKKALKLFASEGQKRTFTIALRLAEYRMLLDRIKSPPLLSFDDFGSHLDETRQNELKSLIQNLNQVFITLPDKGAIFKDRKTNFIPLQDGKVANSLLPV